MSYSFQVRGPTKADVMEKAGIELAKVVASQPVHAADRDAAIHAANVFVDVIPLPNEAQDYHLSVSGWLNYTTTGMGNVISAANVNVTASVTAKLAA